MPRAYHRRTRIASRADWQFLRDELTEAARFACDAGYLINVRLCLLIQRLEMLVEWIRTQALI